MLKNTQTNVANNDSISACLDPLRSIQSEYGDKKDMLVR